MSILIKGMKMPENCIKCPMQFGGMCYVMPAEVDESRVAPTVEEALKQGKPDWCPLVEVPESHGDLIDREAPEIVRCGECVNFAERDFCKVAGHNVHRKSNCMQVFGAERRTE